MEGFRWCPKCSGPHALTVEICPKTGLALHAPEPASSNPLIGLVLDGKYRLLEKIGGGGMGEVFEAEGLGLARRFAIKIATSGNERLRREARMVAELHHPNVCAAYDVGETSWGAPYVVLERLFGETLAQRQQRGRLSAPGVFDVVAQVLSGLHAAHAVSIAHRDVKPENVFLVERAGLQPVAKILDFGFALDISGDREMASLTQPGWTCGTIQYMAPEQLLGGMIDHRADIFATAVLLFESLTGRGPFRGRTPVDLARDVTTGRPIRLSEIRSDLPREMDEVLVRALDREPARRFQTALTFQNALRSVLDTASTPDLRGTDERNAASLKYADFGDHSDDSTTLPRLTRDSSSETFRFRG